MNGKIYDKDYIKYKNIEYINGYIKEYDHDNINKLIYEGEYLNGRRHGKGKEFNNKGNIKFEGEYYWDSRLRGKIY